MPEPLQNENREEFLDRCMSDNEAVNSFPDNDQRFAFCSSQWDNTNIMKDENKHDGNILLGTQAYNGMPLSGKENVHIGINAKDKILTKSITSKVQDLDKTKGIVKIAVAGFNNVDSDGEIIANGAFTKTIRENIKRIKHLKDHDFRLLLGLPLEFQQTQDNLIVVSAINKDKQLGKDVLSDYLFFADNGRTIEHSIGFVSFPDKTDFDETTGARVFKEVKLLEYSTLSFLGANENTPFLGMKASDYERMLSYDYSEERLKQIEDNLLKLNSFFENMEPSNTLNEPLNDDTSQEFFKQLIKNLNGK